MWSYYFIIGFLSGISVILTIFSCTSYRIDLIENNLDQETIREETIGDQEETIRDQGDTTVTVHDQEKLDGFSYKMNYAIDLMEKDLDALQSESLEEMAEFADHVCHEMNQNKDFCESQAQTALLNLKEPDFTKRNYHLWNDTSFGNLAYLALHGHPDHRKDYLNILEGFFTSTGIVTEIRF